MPHVGPGVEETLIGFACCTSSRELAHASVFSIFLEVLLYGAFCVVALECVQALRQRARDSKPHWYMTFTFAALFVLISMVRDEMLPRGTASGADPHRRERSLISSARYLRSRILLTPEQ